MRENESTRIVGCKVILVPYEAHLVSKYHGWMESEELRELTASERLTLEEEYEMQRKWREDSDKCTFIVLDRQRYENSQIVEISDREIDSMVGDVNIFFVEDPSTRCEGEVEIMIAEPSAQGKGFGKEAVCLMMKYAQETLLTKKFTCKIGCGNAKSLHMFRSLGFTEVSKSDVFQEITLSLDASDPSIFLPWTKDCTVETVEGGGGLMRVKSSTKIKTLLSQLLCRLTSTTDVYIADKEMMAGLEKVLKRLPDDVVEYFVFPEVPDSISGDEIKVFLEKRLDSILAHLSEKIVGYIWQHEPFNLKPILPSTDSIPPHLHGSSSFGDNIEDEWFMVYLLYEITREFAGTVVRVNDNDEEFLLIEAADELPKWLDPETAEKRVYIYNGDLHVIPIPQAPEEFEKYPVFTPTLTEAVAYIRDCACETRCSQPVQNLISKRLSSFPRKTKDSIHHVNCYLPTPLAVLLDDQPSLVSAGVRSFYYRDPLELKACRPMKRFKPDDLVRTRVKMTRCLYAQLVQQQFSPDRHSGWTVVRPSNPDFLEHDIGVKLAHGFEILCSKCKDKDSSQQNGEILEETNPRWQQFQKSLLNKGYFRGEIDGSKLYKTLMHEAKQFYQSQISTTEDDTESVGYTVLRHLKLLEPKFEVFRKAERTLPPSDDDSWINVTPEQVDEMMKSAGGLSAAAGGKADMFDLSKVAESMTSFVEHESGIDGAEFPKASAETEEGDGQFESTGLIQAMQKMFDFPEEEDSTGSDMSEYDWSDGSDDELGSPSKMPKSVKKSNLVKKASSSSTGSTSAQRKTSHSVHFSLPNSSPSHKEANATTTTKSSTTTPAVPARPSGPPPVPPPPRPTRLAAAPPLPARPQEPLKPPDRPASNPPPLPNRPPRQKVTPRPLSKPTAVVKPSAPPPPPPTQQGGKRDKKLEALMDAMDRELAATDVGKSFEREPKQAKPKRPNRPPPPATGAAAAATAGARPQAVPRDIDDEDDDFRPVNIDLNVVKNTLESYKAQQGLPGPASNILAGFGIKLPHDQVNGKA